MFEYKEIVTKKGNRIVLGDLRELIKEFYNVKTIEEAEKYVNSNGEYIIHCPFCKKEGHTKHKLYIKEDFSVGHCFVCTRSFRQLTDEINLEFKVPTTISNFGFGPMNFKLCPMSDPQWTVDKFKYEFDNFNEEGYKYLLGRHKYFSELYKVLGFKFYKENVAIPFIHNGEVFYYQIRFSKPGAKIRYFLPKIDNKPPFIIERDGEARHKIVIVEGVFDAVAALIQCPEFTPVAVLGSSISDYQLNFVRDYCGYVKEILVWMDETDISKRIATKVKKYIDYAPIRVIRSTGEDPEEIMINRINKGKNLQWIKSKVC